MTKTITKQEPKLSVRKPGHWSNRYWRNLDKTLPNKPDKDWKGNEYVCHSKWPSKEIAEQKGQEWEKECRARGILVSAARYLGPVFFPEGDDA